MLTGERVRLRPLEREDLGFTKSLHNDPAVAFWEGNVFPVSSAEEEHWFASLFERGERKVLIVTTLESTDPIGVVSIDLNWRHRSATLALSIAPAHWGKNFGTDTIQTATRYLLNVLGLARVQAQILASNGASLRAFEKAGFQREGVRRKAYLWQSELQDMVMTAALAEDFDPYPMRKTER